MSVHDPAAIRDVARVLRPGGRLVAVTNGLAHLLELRRFVGLPARSNTTFSRENGELLRPCFREVEERDASGAVTFPSRDPIVAYVDALPAFFEGAAKVPDLVGPLVVRRTPVVFVATK